MSQNSMRLPWPNEEVDSRLHQIMREDPPHVRGDRRKVRHPRQLVNGANIGGFLKVANAMLDQGLV